MFIYNIIIITNILFLFQNKNIILPFQKLTIGNFNGLKTIEDLINYNIYTNISIGTPPQQVAHFIDQTHYLFHFHKKLLTYGNRDFSPFLKEYENLKNFWFEEKKSSTFSFNETTRFCTDVYYFKNLNNEEIKSTKIKFSLIDTHIKDAFKCGTLGLNNPLKFDFKLNKKEAFFINELKENDLISEYTFSILYNKKNSLFNYSNDEIFGNFILGESPHVYEPKQYKKEDLIINKIDDWSILVDYVFFNSSQEDYIQEKVNMQINIMSGFIKGTESYRLKIEEIFFKELIEKKLCKVELFRENIYFTDFYLFSCENSFIIQQEIKSFPTLHFKLGNSLEFIFTYKDLFEIFNDRLYFMVIFKQESSVAFKPRWVMGEVFLRKYLAVFNYEKREISFYKNQVEITNIETIKDAQSLNLVKLLKCFCGILIGIIIILLIFLIYKKCKRKEKVIDKELEDIDSNGDKNESENKNEKLLKIAQ